jgi:HlyD family secretion protein
MKPKTIFWLIGVAFVAAVAVILWTRKGNSQQETYLFSKIDRGDILVAISATGTLNAVTTVQVGTQVSGTLAKLYADFNSQVKQGQLLAQLDPTFLKASLSEQKANLDKATAQLNEAKRNFNRATELFSKQMISQVDLDAATTSLETAQASLHQAEAARDRAEVNLQYATILAPISGVVISRNVDVGQTVAASLSAPTLFTIANDLSKMQVTASVDEADIGQVKTGQRVTFRVDSYAERQFEGAVSQIRLSPVVSQNVVTYNVIIDVENPDQKLMPGMTATCSIEVASAKNVLRVPLAAFRFTPANWTADSTERRNAETQMSGAQASPNTNHSDSMGRQTGSRMGDSTRRGRWAGRGQSGGDSASMHRPGMMRDSLKSENAQRARIWVMEEGKLSLIRVVRGIQNQRYAELIMSTLAEGDSVIVGTNSPAAAPPTASTNPFIPRMPGGGPSGGSRGR